MRIKTRTERYNFTFKKETSELLKKISEKTDMNYTLVVQRALEDYAKKKEVSNG